MLDLKKGAGKRSAAPSPEEEIGSRTTAGGARRRPPPFGAYWLKGTFSQPRTPASEPLPATVNRT